MSSNQVIHALYDDDDVLLSAVKSIREKKHHIEEVYTPFPVHGLDKALGLADTRISIMKGQMDSFISPSISFENFSHMGLRRAIICNAQFPFWVELGNY